MGEISTYLNTITKIMIDSSKRQDITAIISIDSHQYSVSTITTSVEDSFRIEISVTSESASLETVPKEEDIKVTGVTEIETGTIVKNLTNHKVKIKEAQPI